MRTVTKRIRGLFRYSERVVKYIQDSTRRKLESIGVNLDSFAQLKQWNSGRYYGNPGKDKRWLLNRKT